MTPAERKAAEDFQSLQTVLAHRAKQRSEQRRRDQESLRTLLGY
jgi:hypothetical protein